jgi:hypothetical protein
MSHKGAAQIVNHCVLGAYGLIRKDPDAIAGTGEIEQARVAVAGI